MSDKNTDLLRITDAFDFLRDTSDEVKEELVRHARIVSIPKGELIFVEGDECTQMGLILSGVVRIYKLGESGREITLYRLGAGECCVLTASCIFTGTSFPAIAVTEEDVEIALVPSHIFRDWINRFEIWRNYIFTLLSRKLSDIIATLQEVAFHRMDMRIAEMLIKLNDEKKGDIRTTHQDIAMELGTSREVVSRILKHFEDEKIITLRRGYIIIEDVEVLKKKLAQSQF